MKNKISNGVKKLIPLSIYFMPLLAAAKDIQEVIGDIKGILESIIPLLMIIATVVFLWGVIRYITSAGDEDKIAEGRRLIIYGLIGLFVMVAVWGLVQVLVTTFGVGGTQIPGDVGDL